MLLENDPGDRDAMCRALDSEGCIDAVETAPTCKDARLRLESAPFDAVLVSPDFDGGNGLRILENVDGVPVICLAAAGNEESAIEALDRGAADVVVKDRSGLYLRLLRDRVTGALAHNRREELCQLLMDTVPNPMVMVTVEGRIAKANASAEKVFGYRKEEMVGRSSSLLLDPDSQKRLARTIEQFVRDPQLGVRLLEGDIFGMSRDGMRFSVEIGLSAAHTWEGFCVCLAIVDLTPWKEAEKQTLARLEKLEDLNQQLAHRNELLGEFAFLASHDLKEPLATVEMFVKFLKEELPRPHPPQATIAMDTVSSTLNRMGKMINDLLALSRYDRSAMRWETFPLDESVDQAIRTLDARLRKSDTEIVRDPLPKVCGDRSLLTQVYQNLICNAIKFSKPELRKVEIGSEQKNGTWVLGVRDYGIGVPPESSREIFLPFKRLHSRMEYDGVGMGLAHCQRIVDLHGGKIWVESEGGKGSHFRFTLGNPTDTTGV